MSTYVIGDVQGCFHSLLRLLEQVSLDERRDRLWFVGDLVNRGPRSLEALRWVRDRDAISHVVLGNHDLNLLACGAGIRPLKPGDTLQPVLDAPDRAELLAWLRARPLLYREGEFVMVHAGLLPSWSVEEAEGVAREVSRRLRAADGDDFLAAGFDWRHDRGARRVPQPGFPGHLLAGVNVLTRVRTITRDARLCLDFTGRPEEAPAGCRPWFEFGADRRHGATVLFGHWATLGLHVTPHAVGLDSGCVYGNRLSAFRLEDRRVFQVDYAD